MEQQLVLENLNLRKKRRPFFKTFWRQRYLMILVLPVILWLIIFNYLPMFGLIMAFQNYNMFLGPLESFTQSEFVGLENFIEALEDRFFLNALRNSIVYSLLNLVVGFPFPIIFAILLNEIMRTKFKRFVQTVSYLPHFISWVFVMTFTLIIFAVDNGPVNIVLMRLGLTEEPVPFLITPEFVPPFVVGSQLWKSFGWNSIIYIAAITSIDQTMYEAATVDGAGRFSKIWHITLPSIKPTIVILLIFNVGGLISANFGMFEQLYLLSNGMIQSAAEIIDTYTFRMGIMMSRFSYAAAVGVFRSVLAVILLTIANFTARRLTGESLF